MQAAAVAVENLERAVGADRAARFAVFAGDIVPGALRQPSMKPDPVIYRLALHGTRTHVRMRVKRALTNNTLTGLLPAHRGDIAVDGLASLVCS
jgi:hypothetical protein